MADSQFAHLSCASTVDAQDIAKCGQKKQTPDTCATSTNPVIGPLVNALHASTNMPIIGPILRENICP
jgi:hypothetical protein